MPVLAIVGRPNVGKSMLFNKLAGKRLSIVENTPGVTRDRLYTDCEWAGRTFTLVDTGGLEPRTDDEMLRFMRTQAMAAIDTADVILMLTDIQVGVTAQDVEVASLLQRSGKPVVLCVNKVDGVGAPPSDLYEFYNLGLGEPYPVSALHGHGSGDALDACLALFPHETDSEDGEADSADAQVRVAIIGKPNVGKSSLLNRILGEERVVVSDVAGTTRDAVDEPYDCEYGHFVFTDTAGLRRKSRVEHYTIESYSVLRTSLAIERSDVCLILIDAAEGVTEQDVKVAGLAHDGGKPSVLLVNKWDSIEKDDKSVARFTETLRRELAYMPYAPALFISAKTGHRVPELFPLIREVYEQSRRRITTGQLNEVLSDAMRRAQPPSHKGRRLKIFYITQPETAPPHFVAFCNEAELFHFSYRRYLENRIREAFSLTGTPIKFTIRERRSKE